MAQPVIFLTFANQVEKPLPQLSEEDRIIYETLIAISNAESYKIHRDQHTTASSIINMLRTFRNSVSIFHFGGHAASAHLYLADQPIQGQGLIQLLALQKPLRLVFLNGCNTSGFINHLLEAGIPAIIATTRSVEDPLAVKLAEQFYKSLTAGSTIGESFAFAKGALEGDGSAKPDTIARRGIKLPTESKTEFPWGLYYKDDKALDWRLSEAVNDLSPVPSYFWVRLGLLISLIFGVFTWGNIHLGYENLTLYLAIGPLALVAITTALLKLFSSRYPRIISQVGRPLFSILNILVKPVTLVLLLLIVIGLFLMISSVRITHPDKGPLQAKLLSPEYQSVKYWRVDAKNPDQTRILALVNPAARKHLLNVEGYQEKPIHYGMFGGVRLPIDSLQAHPAILARIPYGLLNKKRVLTLNVERNGKQLLQNKVFGASGSILLGNNNTPIPESVIVTWKNELSQMSPAAIDKAIGFWKLTSPDSSGTVFHHGDNLTFYLMHNDTVEKKKQIVLQNQRITDVLLNE